MIFSIARFRSTDKEGHIISLLRIAMNKQSLPLKENNPKNYLTNQLVPRMSQWALDLDGSKKSRELKFIENR